MTAVIIDDEKKIRDTTRALIQTFAPEVIILGEADGVESGRGLIEAQRPEVVFLDVEMADGTGFDLLSSMADRHFSVIFITAHDHFALRAFRFSAIDYLLKPVDPDELVKAVERAKTHAAIKGADQKIEHLVKQAKSEEPPRKIILSDATNVHLIDISSIVRCQSENNYTRFFIATGEEILVSKTLKDYEELLTDSGFYRVHQSHLINLGKFARMDKREGGTIFMTDGSEVPVAVRRRDELMDKLRSL